MGLPKLIVRPDYGGLDMGLSEALGAVFVSGHRMNPCPCRACDTPRCRAVHGASKLIVSGIDPGVSYRYRNGTRVRM